MLDKQKNKEWKQQKIYSVIAAHSMDECWLCLLRTCVRGLGIRLVIYYIKNLSIFYVDRIVRQRDLADWILAGGMPKLISYLPHSQTSQAFEILELLKGI